MSQPSAPASDADGHASFIKTPQQLIVVVLLAFLVPIFGIVLILQMVVSTKTPDPGLLSPAAVSARIQPVGTLEVVDANAPRSVKTGEEIVQAACAACHMAGVAGAPKIGDKAAWGKFAKAGLDTMLKNAVTGRGAMPPRGGVPDLSDIELAKAIVYMANQSGANLKEPAASSDAAGAPAASAKPERAKRK